MTADDDLGSRDAKLADGDVERAFRGGDRCLRDDELF
jgi:hypothetical protein